jgi:hypothetical protein
MIQEFNELNSTTFDMIPPEGSIVLFPSRIQHTTESVVKDFTGERLAIVGDIILTLKEDHLNFSMGFIDPKYWKQY